VPLDADLTVLDCPFLVPVMPSEVRPRELAVVLLGASAMGVEQIGSNKSARSGTLFGAFTSNTASRSILVLRPLSEGPILGVWMRNAVVEAGAVSDDGDVKGHFVESRSRALVVRVVWKVLEHLDRSTQPN